MEDDELFTPDGGLTVYGRARLRSLCERTVCRLPGIKEFEEWSNRLELARSDEQLIAFASQIASLVESYQQYLGLDILRGKTIFERLAERPN